MKDLEFLNKITTIPGGSGNEDQVRYFLKEEISKVTIPQVDGMGNVYGTIGQGPKVLAVGHMDEIGFAVRGITNDGLILVSKVGYVFPYGQECQIYTLVTSKGEITGVMGRNPNQGKVEKFNEVQDIELETIDIGCTSKKEVEELGVEIGDQIIFKNHFNVLKNNQLLAKAWDNRIGCAISVKVLQEVNKDLKVTYVAGGTVQEEVGCRGAKALAYNIKPDIAFSLDTSPSSNEDGFILGKGPQLFVMDSGTIANKKLLKYVKDIANKNNIPYQVSLLRRGGTDASAFQNTTGGAPTLAIGIVTKNVHTPVSIISYDDYQNCVKLMKCVLESLDEETVNQIKSF